MHTQGAPPARSPPHAHSHVSKLGTLSSPTVVSREGTRTAQTTASLVPVTVTPPQGTTGPLRDPACPWAARPDSCLGSRAALTPVTL